MVVPEARAQGADPVRIWYRSSQGCPEGAAFIARLANLGLPAALAGVGDRVDFVVTLAMDGEVSAGRLERQTARGTVAIRELDAASCTEVAEALALSLELTLAPGAPRDATSTPAPVTASPSPPDANESSGVETSATKARTGGADSAQGSLPGEPRDASTQLVLGAHAGLASGLAPAASFGGDVFVALGNWARLHALASYGRGAVEPSAESNPSAATLAVTLLAGRLDSCPLGYRREAFEMYPCVGLELGLLRAQSVGDGAQTDEALWSGAVAQVRAAARLTPPMWAELGVGVRAPFVRYTLATSRGAELFQAAALGVEAGVGIRWAP